jgi:hypothetical protein
MQSDHLRNLFEYLQTVKIIILCVPILDYTLLIWLLTDPDGSKQCSITSIRYATKKYNDDVIVLSWLLDYFTALSFIVHTSINKDFLINVLVRVSYARRIRPEYTGEYIRFRKYWTLRNRLHGILIISSRWN